MQRIYLDYNATSPLDPRVAEAMARCQQDAGGNPSSQHAEGRCARRALEDAREGIAEILGARLDGPSGDRLIFTSGGTESNNLAILGLAGPSPARAIVSAVEHPAVAAPAQELAARGWQIDRISVDGQGIISAEELARSLHAETRFASLQLASNETGVLQPIEKLAEICVERGVSLHTDAAQAVGRIAVNFRTLGVSALSASPHKFQGPRGIGLLLVRGGTSLVPQIVGGPQEYELRGGTEPVVLAVGMFEAFRIWRDKAEDLSRRMTELREHFEAALLREIPGATVAGDRSPRLPQTINIAFEGLDRQALVMALDLAGIACSTGSACASGSSESSPVLSAMGLDRAVIEGSIRLSFGPSTTRVEVDEAARRIVKICNNLRSPSERRKVASTSRVGGPDSV